MANAVKTAVKTQMGCSTSIAIVISPLPTVTATTTITDPYLQGHTKEGEMPV